MAGKESGHHFLARMGKTRLRPGGVTATNWLLDNGQFSADKKVLEVACNMGTTAIEVAKKYHCHIIGLDVDKEALNKATENVKAAQLESLISFQYGTASKLPFDDNTFDIIINEAMLTMFKDNMKEAFLQEYLRVLKPNGKLLTHDVALVDGAPEEIVQKMREVINVNAQPLTVSGWKNLFQNAGFKQVEYKEGPMTLTSPSGLIRDEGILGALKIAKNAFFNPANRKIFLSMAKVFNRNKNYLHYIAVCSTK